MGSLRFCYGDEKNGLHARDKHEKQKKKVREHYGRKWSKNQ